jgi:hypothetical protein
LILVSDPAVTATAYVREVSPVVDPKSATVRVKIAILDPPTAMTLGKRCGRNRQREAGRADRIAMERIDGMGFAARGLDRRSLDKGGVAEAGDDRRLRSQCRTRQRRLAARRASWLMEASY